MLYALFVIMVGMVIVLLAPAAFKVMIHIIETILSILVIMVLFVGAVLWEGYEQIKKLIKKLTGGNK